MTIIKCDRCGRAEEWKSKKLNIHTYELDHIHNTGGSVIVRQDLCISCLNLIKNFILEKGE